jgi:hypothetical protein
LDNRGKDEQMLASAVRFNLIKIITMAVVLGFMVFTMLAGKSEMFSECFLKHCFWLIGI